MERHSAQVWLTHRAQSKAAAKQARVSVHRGPSPGRHTCAARATPSIAHALAEPRSNAA
jgi:hypothetical protein